MRSGLGLSVLGLLCLHNLVMATQLSGNQSGVLIFCDDHSVEKAAYSAVSKFNQRVTVGHKMALYQILSAIKSESNGDDTVYTLQFTVRKSDCPADSDKPWRSCDYLPENKKPFTCNATVHMTETEADAREVGCLLEDRIVSSRASCLGCPIPVEVTSEELKSPLSLSVTKFNSGWNHTHFFKLNKVVHATRQLVAGFRFKLRFDLQKTKCAKAEHADLHELCLADLDDLEFANCNATVDVAPWRHEAPGTHVVCEKGELQRVIRRRPPGWSPLRNFSRPDAGQAPTAPPAMVTLANTAAPTEASVEEDSSSSNAAASDSPFHCPSKPWKAFTVEAAAPTQQPVASEEEGTFSDADLLA